MNYLNKEGITLKDLGFEIPKSLEDKELELYFIDRYNVLNGRVEDECIRWNSETGLCYTHPFDLIKNKEEGIDAKK